MSTRTDAPESPYKGLRPFEATAVDALLFFGRERERELLAANLTAARLTVLYGESGVGKSSVLRAGVVHPLRQQAREGAGFAVALYSTWSDEDPIEGIAKAVREAVEDVLGDDPGPAAGTLAERLTEWTSLVGEIYLVLDQVDEYFLYHGAAGGGPLLDELPLLVTEPGLPVNVLLGIREDALARLDVFKARIPSLFGNYLRLERLGREPARAAIVGPLQQWSRLAGDAVRIEPALVDTVLDEVAVGRIGGNGATPRVATRTVEPPYLQVVLERLWEAEREEGSSVIRLATLERLGGARRIVGEHLDRALSSLDPTELDTAAAMFSHLVTPSGAKVAHDVGDLAAYAGVDEAAVRDVTASLVDERILRPVEGPQGDGSRVEIFHDVLAAAVAAWGRDHEAARALEAERAEASRKHRRLLALVVAALIALAGMTLVAIYAVAQQHEADDQRALASSEARVAKGSALAAQALQVLPANPALALKYAATAATIDPTRGEDVLRRTLVESRQRNVFGNRGDEVVAASFSPNGKRVALGDAAGRVVVAPRLGRPFMRRRHGRAVNALVFVGNDGLATASSNGTIAIWDLRTKRRVRTLPVGKPVLALAVSSDGRRLAAGGDDRRVRVFGLRTGKLIRNWSFPSKVEHVSFDAYGERLLAVGRGHARLFDFPSGVAGAPFDAEGRVIVAALSPGGRLVATGGKGKHAGVAHVWDASSGVVLSEITGHTNGIVDVEFDPVKPLLVTASADGTARVYNVAVPRRPRFVAPLIGHTQNVLAAGFSPDGERVLTASKDKTAAVWRPEGNLLVSLVGHGDDVYGAELTRDGRYALTWSADGTARVWDAEPEPIMAPKGGLGGVPVRTVFSRGSSVVAALNADGSVSVKRVGMRVASFHPAGPVSVLALSPNGRTLALCTDAGACGLWTTNGKRIGSFDHGGRVFAAAFSGDGRRIVTAGDRGRGRVWKVDDRTLLADLQVPNRTLTAAALDVDGGEVALGDGRGRMTLWDVASKELQYTRNEHADDITSLAFSPNGRLLLSGSRDHDARIWRVSDGKSLHTLVRHAVEIRDAEFSPDGRWVVTVGETRVILWSTASGARIVLLQDDDSPFLSATFTADSRVVRATAEDGGIRTYRCDVCGGISELRALADKRLGGHAP